MADLISAVEALFSILLNMCTVFSLLIASGVAIVGLSTWRKQLKGTANYELAKRILTATYQLRNALENVRCPVITAGESAHAIREAELEMDPRDEEYDSKSLASVYQVRWKLVNEAQMKLENDFLEAEALWGKEVGDALLTIRRTVGSLNSALDLILRDNLPGKRILDKKTRAHFETIIYRIHTDPEDDEYLKQLNEAIAAVEGIAKPYLIR